MNASFGPFLLILVGILLGVILRRSGHLPAGASKSLNAYVIAIAVPALVLTQVPPFLRSLLSSPEGMTPSLFFLPLVPWLIFFGSIGFFGFLHRRKWIRREEWGLLVLAAGLGNTAFVGFPLIEALLGRENLPAAILLDQLGTFLALSLGGPLWVSYLHSTRGTFSWRKFLGEVVRFPPLLALAASFLALFWPPFPPLVEGTLERIAATLVPVAMVSVGAQLRFDRSILRREAPGVVVGLGYKMVLAPIGIAVLASFVMPTTSDAYSVVVLESAMAPMITSTVLGMESGFAPDLGALMLGVGIPLSLVSVPLVHALLQGFT